MNFYLPFVQFAFLTLTAAVARVLQENLPHPPAAKPKKQPSCLVCGSFQSYPGLENKPVTLAPVYNKNHKKPANKESTHRVIQALFQVDTGTARTQ